MWAVSDSISTLPEAALSHNTMVRPGRQIVALSSMHPLKFIWISRGGLLKILRYVF